MVSELIYFYDTRKGIKCFSQPKIFSQNKKKNAPHIPHYYTSTTAISKLELKIVNKYVVTCDTIIIV